MILALVGRRIDPPEADHPRFPLRNADRVRSRIRALLASQASGTLVCSAACGADLLALDAAGEQGWKRRVILPFGPARFRETSVMDRPGPWGPLYERILAEVAERGDLRTEFAPSGREAYSFVNECILAETERLAGATGHHRAAVIVWDGDDYGPADLTAVFAAMARKRGMTVLQVSTLD
ncbi:MAG TPA: hypothetical protein VG456_08165 [Candidatus Sulfopaludibacter sp.]|jgi:hypothetical protein|nr:hypothetical protein [Candidatus Sulfopaludibacter sp.]